MKYRVEVHERGPLGWRVVGAVDPAFPTQVHARQYAEGILRLAVLDGWEVIVRVVSEPDGECVCEWRSSLLPSAN